MSLQKANKLAQIYIWITKASAPERFTAEHLFLHVHVTADPRKNHLETHLNNLTDAKIGAPGFTQSRKWIEDQTLFVMHLQEQMAQTFFPVPELFFEHFEILQARLGSPSQVLHRSISCYPAQKIRLSLNYYRKTKNKQPSKKTAPLGTTTLQTMTPNIICSGIYNYHWRSNLVFFH